VTGRVARVARARAIATTRGGRRLARGWLRLRLAPVRIGSPVGVVFAFHGVGERIEDRRIQINHLELPAFERALDAIVGRFDVVPLELLRSELVRGNATAGSLAALTFDDGYRSILEHVHPILSSRGLPSSLFVCPGLVDRGETLPTFLVEATIRFAGHSELTLPVVGRLRLGGEAERQREAERLVALVKQLPQRDVTELVAACRAHLGDDRWREICDRFQSEQLLGWHELRLLSAAGVSIGAHTSDHVSLHEGNAAVAHEQAAASRHRIEEMLGRECRSFCYPYGRYANLSVGAVTAVARAGFEVGLTLETGTVRVGMSPLLLPRVYVGPKFDPRGLDRLLAPTRDRMFVRETARRGLTGSGSRRIARAPDAPVS
jgi:peptidoglycan/xylan/chitin deacetylase (PgdA/CDA1 family)